MSSQTYDDNMRIIILEVNGVSAGIMVDSVSEVIEVDKTKILPNPQQSNSEINTDYLKGVCKVNEERLMTLLNIEKVLEIKNN
jgi:purine-binding chemotaxis protein CheW